MRVGQSGSGMLAFSAAGASAREPATRQRARSAPRAVTRGESSSPEKVDGRAKVDWLNCTFDTPPMSLAGLISFLGTCMGGRPIASMLDGGLFGFTERHRLKVYVGGVLDEVGSIAMGGDAQRGRWMLQLTGRGCGLVKDWASLRELLEGLNAKITRLDLAVDFLDGEYTVDDAVQMVHDKGFNCGGNDPKTALAGDWLEGKHGRTLYVGKAANGKMLRVYEKGKQLGDLRSPWVRFEVQLGNRDRVIPYEAMTDCDGYFAGAYPALAAMIEAAAERIPTEQTETVTNLGHLLYHLKRCYGKAIHQAQEIASATDTDLIEEFRIIGIPRRVKPSGVVAGLTWSELQDQIRSYSS